MDGRLNSNMVTLNESIKKYANDNNISSNIFSAETDISIDDIKNIKRGKTVVIPSQNYMKIKTFMKSDDRIFGQVPKDKVDLFHYFLYIHGTDTKAFEDVTGIKTKDMEMYIREHRLYCKKADICKMFTASEYNKISDTIPVVLPEKKDYNAIKSLTRSSLLDLFLDKSGKTIDKIAKDCHMSISACQKVFEGAPCNDGIVEQIARCVGTNLATMNSDPYNLIGDGNMIGYFIAMEIKKMNSNIYSYSQRISMKYNDLKSIISGSKPITMNEIEMIFSRIINKYDLEELMIKLARKESSLKAVDAIDVLKATIDKENNFAKSARELNCSTYILQKVVNRKKDISEISHDKLVKFCGTEINKFYNPIEIEEVAEEINNDKKDTHHKVHHGAPFEDRLQYDGEGINFIENINTILANTGLTMYSIYNKIKQETGHGVQLNIFISKKAKYITKDQLNKIAGILGYTPDMLMYGIIESKKVSVSEEKKEVATPVVEKVVDEASSTRAMRVAEKAKILANSIVINDIDYIDEEVNSESDNLPVLVDDEPKEYKSINVSASNEGSLKLSATTPTISGITSELENRVEELENKINDKKDIEKSDLLKSDVEKFFETVEKMSVEEQITLIKILDNVSGKTSDLSNEDIYNDNVLGKLFRYNIIYNLVLRRN